MSGPSRLKLAILLLFAAIVALEPTLHNHSLIPTHGDDAASITAQQTVCAACAIGAGGVVLAPPAVAAPLTISYALAGLVILTASKRLALPLPSRAPPAV